MNRAGQSAKGFAHSQGGFAAAERGLPQLAFEQLDGLGIVAIVGTIKADARLCFSLNA